MKNLVTLIMCGGSGVRLWPLSRNGHPKQFVKLAGDKTLFRHTFERATALKSKHSLVVCNHAHRFFVSDELNQTELKNSTILVEPQAKNTAATATLAALQTQELYADAILLIMPADHLINDHDAFCNSIATAMPAAADGKIVLFGIPPTAASSEYGYIKTAGGDKNKMHDVINFCEKPDTDTAADLLKTGDCFWNSGIFLTTAKTYLTAIAKFEPDIYKSCKQSWTQRYDDLGFVFINADAFAKSPAISIDNAILERAVLECANNLSLLPAEFSWRDLGSWESLKETFSRQDENYTRGDVVIKNSKDNIIYSDNKLVSVVGLDDCIIADTADAVLVARRDAAGDIKSLVADLQKNSRSEANKPHKIFRPWGYFENLNRGDNFQVKRIVINPGHGLSLQTHRQRAEHWVVVSGSACVTRGEEIFTLKTNQSTYIPAQTKHRLENKTRAPLCLIEVQCGNYLGEDDIIRLEDRYGRNNENPPQ